MNVMKWMRGIEKRRVARVAATGTLMALAASNALAVLPVVVAQGGLAANTTDWLTLVKFFFQNGVNIAGLIIAAIGLMMVVSKVFSQYGEVGKGKATWGDVATSAIGGAAIMMLGAAVLAISSGVIT